MYVLCDTCSVLMVIRIAPEMFSDERFECVTLQEVRKEIFRNQRFKTKYPWRDKFKSKIPTLQVKKLQTPQFTLYFEAIKNSIGAGAVNQRTGELFDLSPVDQVIAACTLANNYNISTGDRNLSEFLKQEFSKDTISSLGLVNNWLRKGLITWSPYHQTIIEDWDKLNERPQPKSEAKGFKRLTGCKYVGPVR